MRFQALSDMPENSHRLQEYAMCCILCDEPVRSIAVGMAAFAAVAVVKAVRGGRETDNDRNAREHALPLNSGATVPEDATP